MRSVSLVAILLPYFVQQGAPVVIQNPRTIDAVRTRARCNLANRLLLFSAVFFPGGASLWQSLMNLSRKADFQVLLVVEAYGQESHLAARYLVGTRR